VLVLPRRSVDRCASIRIIVTRGQRYYHRQRRNVFFKPTSEERDTLKKAVAKFAHDPVKSQLLSGLDAEDAEYRRGSEEWNHLKFCFEQHHLHPQN
jgi:hypothetical protein